jgi:hypothetical protein
MTEYNYAVVIPVYADVKGVRKIVDHLEYVKTMSDANAVVNTYRNMGANVVIIDLKLTKE